MYLWCRLVVDNLLKYTGYGNAAGLLVARGLLAGGRGETEYSEDEDSDTEEYKSAKPLWVFCTGLRTKHWQPDVNLFLNMFVCTDSVWVCLQLYIKLPHLLVPASTQSPVTWRSRCRTPLRRWRRSRRSTKPRNLSICLTSCQGKYTKLQTSQRDCRILSVYFSNNTVNVSKSLVFILKMDCREVTGIEGNERRDEMRQRTWMFDNMIIILNPRSWGHPIYGHF